MLFCVLLGKMIELLFLILYDNLKKKLKSCFFEDNDNKPTLTDFRALTSPTPHSLSLRFVGLVNILDTRQNYLKTYI